MTDPFTIVLISEIKKYPVLYEVHDENYLNTALRSKIWNQIAEALGSDVHKIQSKFKFLKHKRKQLMTKKILAKDAGFIKMMKFLDSDSSKEDIKIEPIYNEDEEDPQESDELMTEESTPLETEQLFTNGVDYEILLKDAKKPRNYEELFLLSLAGSMSKLDDEEQMNVKTDFLRILSEAHERCKKKRETRDFQDSY